MYGKICNVDKILVVLHSHNYILYLFITDFRIAYAATTTISSAMHILPYNDLLFYMILIFHNFSKHNIISLKMVQKHQNM